MDRSVLARKQLVELKGIASQLQMRGYQRLRKADLVDAIIRAATEGDGDSRPARNGDESRPAARESAGTTATATPGTSGPASSGPAATGPAEQAPPPRVRTRTRERTEEEREGEGDAAMTAPSADVSPATTSTTSAPAATAADMAADSRSDQPRQDVQQQNPQQQDLQQPDLQHQRARQGQEPSGRDRQGRDRQGQERQGQERQGQERQGQDRQRSQTQGSQIQGSQGPQDGGADGDQDEDSNRRRRRSRRERRRNKGADGGNDGEQTAVQARPQHGTGDEDTGTEPGETRAGVLDILPEGYGFLRTSGYLAGDRDVYVSQSQVRRHALRRGDLVDGPIRQQRSSEKVPALHSVGTVNGTKPDDAGNLPHRPEFKDMTPLFPDERLRMETPDGPISMRIVDLMSPIGKGQRGLVVSPPKAGKTTILKELGQAIAANNPECHLMVVLVDERPEEVTDMRRSVPGEIIASTFDRPADDHTSIAELAIERAKRLVELGGDVVILLDSITRLSRAYNLAAPASGRIMSGGVDSTALYPPKRFFGAARNIEDGGSLTIIATALIETGSKMDEVIFEEFKGTGNMELRLDRRLEQKRIFPAIDIGASGTRREELLIDQEELVIIWKLRRVLHALEGPSALELLIDKMKTTKSNNQFLIQIQRSNLQT